MTIRSFRNCTFHWNRKSQTWQIGVQTSKPLWHGPDLMNFLNFMNVSPWFSHVSMFCPFLSSEAVEPSQSSGVQRPPRSLLLPRSLTSHHWSHLFWVPTSVFVLSDLAFLADVEDCQSDRDLHLRSSSQGPGGAGHGSLSKTFSMQHFFVLFPCGGLTPLCLFMSFVDLYGFFPFWQFWLLDWFSRRWRRPSPKKQVTSAAKAVNFFRRHDWPIDLGRSNCGQIAWTSWCSSCRDSAHFLWVAKGPN